MNGIRCPNCNSGFNRVVNTRASSRVEIRGKRLTVIKRRRQCHHCGTGWWTYERNEEDILRESSTSEPAEVPKGEPIDDNPYL